MENIFTAPNNDHRTQDGTAGISDPNNTKDNAVADLLRSSKLPDAEEMMLRILNGESGIVPGVPFQHMRYQSLLAVKLLTSARKEDRPRVLRLLKQGGFDVGELATESATAVKGKEDPLGVEFCEDVLSRARWKLLPIKFVVDLFNRWLKIYHPDVSAYTWAQIKDALTPLVDKYGWMMPGYNAKGNLHRDRPGDRMEGEEPLIKEFKLTEWFSFVPDPKKTYAGLRRKAAT